MDQFIVAEVSKTWIRDKPREAGLLSHKFELVINTNDTRGYKLTDWKLSQVATENELTETIIAIFEKK